jgi:hypothetical protein
MTPYSKTVHINITGSKIDSVCNAKVGNFPDTLDSFSVSNWTGCRVEDQDFKIRNYTRGQFVDLDIDIRINRKTGLIDAKASHKTTNTGYYSETQASGICPDLVKNSKSKKSVSNNNPSTLNKTPKKGKGYSSGTGFYVNKKGLMITNNHVVKSCNKIKVDGSSAVVKSFDTTNDLALLKVDSSSSSTPDFRAGRGIRRNCCRLSTTKSFR